MDVPDVKQVAVIATHHKTGTVWMRSVFQRIAKNLKLKFSFVEELQGTKPEALTVPSIILADHSAFPNCRWLLKHPESRLFHLIRDPRDIVVSAMHYHRTAAEPWLHKPWRSLGGMTYQDKINSLQDDQARYVFEMRNIAKQTIKAMRKWNYKRANSFECRYENLIDDREMTIFTEALLHLGFERHELEMCCNVFRKKSLFGLRKESSNGHVRSGAAQQWKKVFNSELANEFVAQFRNVLVDLGYERDNSWVDDFTPSSEESGPANLHSLGDQALKVQ